MTTHSPQEHNNAVVRDGALVCPRCGKTNLHLHNVVVYHREEDDPPIMTETHVRRGSMPFSLESDWDSCPSQGRDGLLVMLGCEQCGDGFELAIMQDQGQTILQWHYIPPADEAARCVVQRAAEDNHHHHNLSDRIASLNYAMAAANKELTDIISELRKRPWDEETRYFAGLVAELGKSAEPGFSFALVHLQTPQEDDEDEDWLDRIAGHSIN